MFHVSDKRQGQQHRSQMEAETLGGPGGNEVSEEEALPPLPSTSPPHIPLCLAHMQESTGCIGDQHG